MNAKTRSFERGAALIEVAFTIPLLLLVAIGAIEVGRYANYAIVLANAARAGVQYGSQSLTDASDTAGMQAAAVADGAGVGLTTSGVTASHYCLCSDGTASTCLSTDCPLPLHRNVWVKVVTTGSLNSLLNYPLIPTKFNITQTAVMMVDQY